MRCKHYLKSNRLACNLYKRISPRIRTRKLGNAEKAFGWGSMYEGFCDGCSAIANTSYEFGAGMLNGFTSPMDTAGRWINSGLNSVAKPAPSMAKRFGEVCGVVALGVSFYTGGVALATGGWTTSQFCVQGTRLAAKRVANDIGRPVVADAMAEAVGPAVESILPVIFTQLNLSLLPHFLLYSSFYIIKIFL